MMIQLVNLLEKETLIEELNTRQLATVLKLMGKAYNLNHDDIFDGIEYVRIPKEYTNIDVNKMEDTQVIHTLE